MSPPGGNEVDGLPPASSRALTKKDTRAERPRKESRLEEAISILHTSLQSRKAQETEWNTLAKQRNHTKDTQTNQRATARINQSKSEKRNKRANRDKDIYKKQA